MRIDTSTTPVPPLAPTNPFHIARAYGVQPAARSVLTAPIGPIAGVRAEGVAAYSAGPQRSLIAAMVPGGVEFGAAGATGANQARPSGQVLQMYRHPADKNAAATAVDVGRRLDARG